MQLQLNWSLGVDSPSAASWLAHWLALWPSLAEDMSVAFICPCFISTGCINLGTTLGQSPPKPPSLSCRAALLQTTRLTPG